jgi:hypothetical protein
MEEWTQRTCNLLEYLRNRKMAPGVYKSLDEYCDQLASRSKFQKVYDWVRYRLLYILTNEIPWWFRHRFDPRHRYHVLRTGLEPGWRDRDFLIAWMVRKIFLDFVEQEKPFDWFNTEDSHHKEKWDRVKELYNFWKTTNFDEFNESDYDVLTEKLCETIRLRKMFWT